MDTLALEREGVLRCLPASLAPERERVDRFEFADATSSKFWEAMVDGSCGSSSDQKSVDVPLVADGVTEGQQTFTLVLSSPTNALRDGVPAGGPGRPA